MKRTAFIHEYLHETVGIHYDGFGPFYGAINRRLDGKRILKKDREALATIGIGRETIDVLVELHLHIRKVGFNNWLRIIKRDWRMGDDTYLPDNDNHPSLPSHEERAKMGAIQFLSNYPPAGVPIITPEGVQARARVLMICPKGMS